jgi:signal peptidase I
MPTWPLGLYRVEGESMLPTYRPGDLLLGLRWFRPRPGHVVVAEQAGRMLVKRLAAVTGGQMTLLGDNLAHSNDSRHFGPLPQSHLRAKIIAKL